MKKAVTNVDIELQVDELVLDDSLEVLETLLDGLAARGLIKSAHIYIDAKPQLTQDPWGPMLTSAVQ